MEMPVNRMVPLHLPALSPVVLGNQHPCQDWLSPASLRGPGCALFSYITGRFEEP